jgi:ATP-dependent Lon protease
MVRFAPTWRLNDLKSEGLPGGATPKDGPLAGVTMPIALASLYTKAAARNDTAMTGEITLPVPVWSIDSVKEKILVARRAGIGRVILSRENEKDLREVPDSVRVEMGFIFIERVKDALSVAIPGLTERMSEPKAA